MTLSKQSLYYLKLLRDHSRALKLMAAGVREKILPKYTDSRLGHDSLQVERILVNLDADLGNAAVDLDKLIERADGELG